MNTHWSDTSWLFVQTHIISIFLHVGSTRLTDRVKETPSKIVTLLRTALVNLNIFPIRTFAANTDRHQAKYLGIVSTRVYIVLLIIGCPILALYTLIKPQILTVNIKKPSLTLYKSLLLEHLDTLRCSCFTTSSTYNRFMNIEPLFHQVRRKDGFRSFQVITWLF